MGIDLATVRAVFSSHNAELTLGRTTHVEIWAAVCNALGRDATITLLQEAFESTPVNPGMFSLVRRLKGKYSLGIITDNKKDRIDHLRSFQALDLLFDPIVVSSEIGSNKDSEAIFLEALNYLGLEPEMCIFIDNNRANFLAPSALGMRTIFHDDEKNDIDGLVRSLRAFGVVVEDAA